MSSRVIVFPCSLAINQEIVHQDRVSNDCGERRRRVCVKQGCEMNLWIASGSLIIDIAEGS